jgi:hypothetical protein
MHVKCINKNTEMVDDKYPQENLEHVELDKLFNDSSFGTNQISKSFNEYLSSLDLFYSESTSGGHLSFMRHYEKFYPDPTDEDDVKFISNALRMANYDENSLRNEHVILFSDPVIISELQCTNVPDNESMGAVRLISFANFEKKITIERKLTDLGNKNDITKYKVHDVVFGLILPVRCKFHSLKYAHIASLHTNYENIERTQKALANIREVPLIVIHSLQKQFQRIDSIIAIKSDNFNVMKDDISVLEQEKLHAKKSLDITKDAGKKVRSDLDKSILQYEEVETQIASKSTSLEMILEQINLEVELQKKQKIKFESIQVQTKNMSDSLHSIKEELADASKQKNLTTLDMIGHSNETSKQLRPYYFFASLTFAGLALMAMYIYKNGEDFTLILPLLVNVSAWDILISRLPLITASALIIGALSGTFFYLIKHIVSLNTEKMTMLKAAILAEQITNSLDCKGMTEPEQLEFKRDTKIKLIMQVFSNNEPELEKSKLIIDALKAASLK